MDTYTDNGDGKVTRTSQKVEVIDVRELKAKIVALKETKDKRNTEFQDLIDALTLQLETITNQLPSVADLQIKSQDI